MPRHDYSAFASSFLDLWQEQIARAMSDTDFLQALMEQMQDMQAGMFGYEQPAAHNRHTADASQPEPDELDDLRRRLAAAERKITKLEATIERLRDEPAKPAPKPKAQAQSKPAARGRSTTRRAASPAQPKAKPKAAAKKPATKTVSAAGRKRAVKRK